MRRLRWKNKYLTGLPEIDARNKALVSLSHEIDQELRTKEHCQDMEELYGTLTEVTEERLSQGTVPLYGRGPDEEIRNLLRTSLPLEALDTQACRDCGVCDLFKERVSEWLDQEADGESALVAPGRESPEQMPPGVSH